MTKHKPKSILWVDDDLSESVILHLQKELNIKVDSVSTLSSAIYRLQNTQYNLVITDMIFPQGQQGNGNPEKYLRVPGVWLIRKIREGVFGKRVAEIPIIIFTILVSKDLIDKLDSEKFSGVYAFSKSNISVGELILKASKLI